MYFETLKKIVALARSGIRQFNLGHIMCVFIIDRPHGVRLLDSLQNNITRLYMVCSNMKLHPGSRDDVSTGCVFGQSINSHSFCGSISNKTYLTDIVYCDILACIT